MTPTEKMRDFVKREVAVAAAKSLANGALVCVTFDDGSACAVVKDNGIVSVQDGKPAAAPDVSFAVPEAALDRLLALETNEVGRFGVELLKQVAHKDASLRILPRIHAGLFTLFRRGYFGVLLKGGPAVASFLAAKGLSSLADLKAAVERIRGRG